MSVAPHITPGRPRLHRGAHFDTCSIGESMVLHTAEGQIDAANATEMSEFVTAHLDAATRLILDLRPLEFFGTQGFSVLHRVNVTCSRIGVTLVVVAGREVDRLLRICDPGGGLPVARTLEDAISAVVNPPRNHLRLVAD